ncbi:MAG: hypothetical protein MJ252_10725, partial [archaeon]|nr:hypothetical protein [archaeon]
GSKDINIKIKNEGDGEPTKNKKTVTKQEEEDNQEEEGDNSKDKKKTTKVITTTEEVEEEEDEEEEDEEKDSKDKKEKSSKDISIKVQKGEDGKPITEGKATLTKTQTKGGNDGKVTLVSKQGKQEGENENEEANETEGKTKSDLLMKNKPSEEESKTKKVIKSNNENEEAEEENADEENKDSKDLTLKVKYGEDGKPITEGKTVTKTNNEEEGDNNKDGVTLVSKKQESGEEAEETNEEGTDGKTGKKKKGKVTTTIEVEEEDGTEGDGNKKSKGGKKITKVVSESVDSKNEIKPTEGKEEIVTTVSKPNNNEGNEAEEEDEEIKKFQNEEKKQIFSNLKNKIMDVELPGEEGEDTSTKKQRNIAVIETNDATENNKPLSTVHKQKQTYKDFDEEYTLSGKYEKQVEEQKAVKALASKAKASNLRNKLRNKNKK